ncbi:hypothetical protein IGI04_014096 [Brassica rapa subsp. trilocularis]|uniref:C2 domain-containing protein n=1 Tax=Brassica rapa subsp. trilocularis TaxID=1813537 RepID=A0ABQ7ML84_BRACM|nr:hypothetical protein IGI04_014096 [Brassica rapa subsp. trilocularis]
METTRSLEINVTSAKGLEKVSKMDVFVAVKLSGDPKCSDHREQRTQVARDSGTSPRWVDGLMKFTIDQTLAEANRLVLTFKIKCEQRGGGGGDKDIGEVHVPVKELLDHLGKDKAGQRYVTYKIKKSNGKPGGDISFTYSFTGPVAVASGVGCSRYIAHEPVRPPAATYRPVNSNGPVLSQLLPSVGSFSYGHVPSHQPPVYPPLAQPEVLPPTCFPGLYPPHGYPMSYTPESVQTMYTSIFPGLSCPPEGYPNAAPPQTQPALYPPMKPYRF